MRVKSSLTVVFGAFCFLFVVACGTTNASVNTEDTVGVANTVGAADTLFELKIKFIDYSDVVPLSGLTLEGFGRQAITNAEGVATLMVPHKGDMALSLKGPGIRDHYFYSEFDSANLDPNLDIHRSYGIATENTITIMYSSQLPGITLAGITIGKTAGLLSMQVTNRATNGSIPGMVLTTDASTAAQSVFDVTSGIGLRPGNTTRPRSPSR